MTATLAPTAPACCSRCSARVAEAGVRERRRLERNLHDGAQQRLVALALQLRTLGERLAPGCEAERMLAAAEAELADSLSELRPLARGPALVGDHGLGGALQDGETLVVQVADDGIGGACAAGLRGLALRRAPDRRSTLRAPASERPVRR